jgi:UDP-N-acetylglucosamine 4,6-dehydratase
LKRKAGNLQQFDFSDLDLNGKDILVTGGTGSFGRAFVSMILQNFNPRRLIIYSRDESKQHDMAREHGYALGQANNLPLRFLIGDVRDKERLELAMHDVDYVIHAAALKHVPMAEYNPMECIKTNVQGAENVVAAALNCNVHRVIGLSTDKAANPINLYGASKLAADKIFIAANHLVGRRETRFSVVRYGNVLGSRGSVVPLFRDLIARNVAALPVTDPRMTRFWITLPRGASFVLSCLSTMQGGEIFIPKIPSMKIVELAAAMAPDLPIETIGIRPGEKLHEVMVTKDEARMTYDLGDRYVIAPSFAFWESGYSLGPAATPVAEDFEYGSDTNDRWFTIETMTDLLNDL